MIDTVQTASHTKGPWSLVAPYDTTTGTYQGVSGEGWDFFAQVVVRMKSEKALCPEGLANAHLIAAAPELLAALEEVLRHCVTVGGFPDKNKGRTQEQQTAYDMARTAMNKALGQ